MDRSRIFRYLDERLGRCPRCMRTSAQVFLIALLVTVLSFALKAPAPWPQAIACVSSAFGLLWLAHLVSFGLRAAKASGGAFRRPRTIESRSRREAFVRALGFAALATAFPLSSRAATCPCAAPKKCCWSFDAGSYVCAPSDAVCCASSNPWYCGKGQLCTGDGSKLPKCR